MNKSELYLECIAALEDLTEAFRAARATIKVAPEHYESNMAAFKLTQLVWIHVNSISSTAAIPYEGSHLVSAWVLTRAAFQAGATSLWLTEPPDWREREARFLRWIRNEEIHQGKVLKDFESAGEAPDFQQKLIIDIGTRRARREAIAAKLVAEIAPAASQTEHQSAQLKRLSAPFPNMEVIIKELNLPPLIYLYYRLGSHNAHAGPSSAESILKRDTAGYSLIDAHSVNEWGPVFRICGWSVCDPGVSFLARCGCPETTRRPVTQAHYRLQLLANQLDSDMSK